MRRWPLRIVLCLILLTGGAVTTVAVAWGLALVVNVHSEGSKAVHYSNGTHWVVSRRIMPGVTLLGSYRAQHDPPEAIPGTIDSGEIDDIIPLGSELRSFRPTRCLLVNNELRLMQVVKVEDVSEISAFVASGGMATLEDHRNHDFRGWPARALWAELVHGDLEKGVLCNGGYWTSLELFGARKDGLPRVLPLRPVWPGFVIDTVFYAAIWCGVFFAPGMAKRAIRRKRGRCPRCGYDLRGGVRVEPPATSLGCPECGWNRETVTP